MNVSVSAQPPPPSLWLRLVSGVVILGGIFWYATFLSHYIAPYAGGSDSSGYFNNARILSEGKFYTHPRALREQPLQKFGDFANVPLGFSLRPDGFMVPTYPTGYSLQLIATSAFGLDRAPVILNIITALGCGVLQFLYCRKLGIHPCLSLGGVALLWICPLFLFSAFQPMSDLSAVLWSLAVLYWALLARENWKYGILCGAALGISVLVRPTNALLAVPVLVALGLRPRLWFVTAIAGLPFAVFFGYYNWRVYGSPWTIGYSGVSNVLGATFVPHNLAHFAHWIPTLLSPLAVLAIAAPFTALGRQQGMFILASWAVALIGFYVFYFHSGEHWWYLRFILPAFPVFIAGALTVLESIFRAGSSRRLITGIALGILLIFGLGWERHQIAPSDVTNLKGNESSYRDAAQWANENLPSNSVVFCMQVSGAFFYYTNFVLFRWEQIDADKYPSALAAIAAEKRPIYAVLYPFEIPEALDKIGGHWTKLSTVGQASVWQRQP